MAGNKQKAKAPSEVWIDEKDVPSEAKQSRSARKSGAATVVKLIDEVFAERITFTMGGVEHRTTILEAILTQLSIKASRDKRARRVLMMYQKIGFGRGEEETSPQTVFVENDYTRMMKAHSGKRPRSKSEDHNG